MRFRAEGIAKATHPCEEPQERTEVLVPSRHPIMTPQRMSKIGTNCQKSKSTRLISPLFVFYCSLSSDPNPPHTPHPDLTNTAKSVSFKHKPAPPQIQGSRIQNVDRIKISGDGALHALHKTQRSNSMARSEMQSGGWGGRGLGPNLLIQVLQ